jgi:deoxyribodipyrimidine photolyase-related protein
MKKTLTLVVADQLFADHPAMEKQTDFVMVESSFLTSKLRYHKFKLVFILTVMREYKDYLISSDKTVYYYNLDEQIDFEEVIVALFQKHKYKELLICEIADKYFEIYLREICEKNNISLTILPSEMFLTPKKIFKEFVDSKQGKRLLMNDFYIQQRKRLGILVEFDDSPVGGKWSFDEENRKKLPKQVEPPTRLNQFKSNNYDDVAKLISKYFPDNPGQIPAYSWLPLNRNQARNYLSNFIQQSLPLFGDYEDALTYRHDLVFHSGLSALLNNGLLTPSEVLEEVLLFKDIPLNSKEGFVRQIIGWREWIKGMYDHVYGDDFLELNYFNAQNKLPSYFYTCLKTEINNLPLEITLDKVNRLAYCHHIERLMVLANWMTLNEYKPAECYNWFVEMFVDSNEWVMVANVMGMGLYADGGKFATKPYVASGNYIKKMSDYPRGKNVQDWEAVWTDKFWNFVMKHEPVFASNPRMNMLIKTRKRKLLEA